MGNWVGYALVVLAAVVFGASSIVIKYTYSTGLAPIPVLIMQTVAAAILAWVWVLLSRKNAAIPVSHRLAMIAQGAVGGFLTSVLFYSALGTLGAALATLLLFTYPAFVVIYEVLFNNYHISRNEKLALAMAFAGLFFSIDIISVKPVAMSPLAIIMGLGSALSYAYANVNGEKLLKVAETQVVTAWSFTFSAGMMLIVYRPFWLLDITLTFQQIALLSVGAVLLMLPLFIYLAGIRIIGAGVASIISTAEIPFTLILAWLFLHEMLSVLQIFGGILITASIVILYYHRME